MMPLFDSSNTGTFADITPEERTKQLNDLEKRLDEMEFEIAEEERQIRVQQQSDYLKNKKKCCLFRCLSTTDIKSDIPGKFQRTVYCMHYLWMFNSLALIMNWVTIFIFYGFHGRDSVTSHHFIMPSLFVLLGIPGGYCGFYRSFFAAIVHRSQTKFMIFNVNFTVHLIFVAIMCTGFTSLNAAGVMLMIKEIVNNTGYIKILIIITTVMWSIDLIATFLLFRKCFKINAVIQYGKLLAKDPKFEIVVAECRR